MASEAAIEAVARYMARYAGTLFPDLSFTVSINAYVEIEWPKFASRARGLIEAFEQTDEQKQLRAVLA